MSRPPSKHRRHRRRHNEIPHESIDIRVGIRRSEDQNQYLFLQLTGERDAPRFEGLLDHVVKTNSGDPLLIVCIGYQPWLETVFQSCLKDLNSDRDELNRETQYADTLRFPKNTNRRYQKTQYLPWTFIVDQINLPDVYYWSFDEEPPQKESNDVPIKQYRFRVGVWTCAAGAYTRNDKLPVTIVFLDEKNPNSVPFVTDLFFDAMYKGDYVVRRTDEASVAYIFYKLFNLLTDWQNIIREFETLLLASELNSQGKKYPVKYRTRAMHTQIDRIYEMLLYLQFHTSCFKKLLKLKPSKDDKSNNNPQAGGNQRPNEIPGEEVVWDDLEDEQDGLEQEKYELDQLKERFDNLTNLEFNIENANQSGSQRFLAIVATLFLPLSYLASIWGITTFTATPIEYVYAAIPVLVVSMIFVVLFRPTVLRVEKWYYRADHDRVDFEPQYFTMLNAQIPEATEEPEAVGKTRITHRGPSEHLEMRSRSRRHATADPRVVLVERRSRSRRSVEDV